MKTMIFVTFRFSYKMFT